MNTQFLACWFRDNGREYPVLLVQPEGEQLPTYIKFIWLDEVYGVAVETRSSNEIRYMRPLTVLDGTEYKTERAVAHYQRMARARGTAEARKLLGVELRELTSARPPEISDELAELYERAGRLLEIPRDQLEAKYGKMNVGMQAMQLRSAIRRAGWQA